MIAATFGAFKALSVVQKFAGITSFIPGIGPIGGIVSAVIGCVMTVVRMIFDGLTVIVSNPATIVTVAAIGVSSLSFGFKEGRAWDGNQAVAAANACTVRVASIEVGHNQKVSDAIADARRAATVIPETPTTPVELKKLCKASASCRERMGVQP